MSMDTLAPRGVDAQPLSHVEWVNRDSLHANNYNPNRVFPPELKLLALSILENGWTQPIVAHDDGEIIDGFHRWTVAEWPEVAALTDGKVPVVRLRDCPPDLARMATIRHNRARGHHHVVKMAEIVTDLHERGLHPDVIATRLGMDAEEVQRLLDRGQMVKRGAADSMGNAWVPR